MSLFATLLLFFERECFSSVCPTTFAGKLCLRYLSISSDLCLAHVKGEVGASLGISRRTGNSFTNQEPGGCISGNGLVYPRRLVYTFFPIITTHVIYTNQHIHQTPPLVYTFFSHNYHTCHIHQSNPFPIQARDFQPDLPRAGVPWALVPGSANDERLCEGSRLILGCSDMDHESCVLAAGVASGDVWRQLL